MCMHAIIVLLYQNLQSVYKSKPSNDFTSYNSQIFVSIWGTAPRPLQVSSPSTSTPLPQISSYISEYVHCCPDMNAFIVWTHFYSMLYNFTTNATQEV